MKTDWEDVKQAVEALRDALERETLALRSADAVALERLSVEKQACLDALEWALPDTPPTQLPTPLSDALIACRELNRSNAEAVATRLAATRRMLDSLGGLLGLDAASVYGADGRVARGGGGGRALGRC